MGSSAPKPPRFSIGVDERSCGRHAWGMGSRATGVSAIVACLLASSSALAAAPTAERIKSAAAEYDAGRRAFTDGKYEDAAVHFENAYHDAPNAQTLRNAIRARHQANQLARAGTLSLLAQDRYADDEQTLQVAKETIAEAAPKLFKLTIVCDPECGVAADGRVLSIEDAKRFAFFLQPGPHAVAVSWPGDRSKPLDIKAKEGQSLEQTLEAPPLQLKVVNGSSTTIGGETTPVEPPSRKPFGPAVFGVMLGLTAVAGGILIWSGIDTLNNPGSAYVRMNCVGLGDQCPAYQQGVSEQTRTNVMIGVTGGVGLLTLITAAFLTQWSHPHVTATVGLGTLGLMGRF
jgi:hypothetical protein